MTAACTSIAAGQTLTERALESLRQSGNPFRNYFARNPDDEVCSRYHVHELYALERQQLLGVVDLFRYDPSMHSEVIPVLGNKGAGKTHLLHSIKHGHGGAWQLLVTPGVYQRDTDFLEYLLFQLIDTLLGGGKQKGSRPLELVSEELVRRLFHKALVAATPEQRLGLFPAPGLGRWTRRLGLGSSQAQDRTQWLLEWLERPAASQGSLRRACGEVSLDPANACTFISEHIERTEPHNTAGLMRRQIHAGFVRYALTGEESELANFLTYGFAELDFKVRPTRQDLVLALFKVLMEVFLGLKTPVVMAFDQLEDLLLARRTEDAHRTAEAFFAGIVQAMHQIDGLCFLIFAERGLWNRFVPSLDGYIQDRLNNPVHLPQHGTIKTLRLEAPSVELVQRVVTARLKPALEQLHESDGLPLLFPFQDDQIQRIAKTEPTLRDMLQQLRHLFDRVVFGVSGGGITDNEPATARQLLDVRAQVAPVAELPAQVKSMIVVESPTTAPTLATPAKAAGISDLWLQEVAEAKAKLLPEGSLTGATRELQAGLGSLLRLCHEHGVKVGPWRLQHVVTEWSFGDHPTYGAISIGHWICKDGQPWKVGVGLFLGKGPAKPKDLGTKLSAFDAEPPMIDHLILLRPEDDLGLSGKSKTLWQESEKRGRHARLEPASMHSLAALYGFSRWIAAITESQTEGQPLPNLADFLQDNCEKLLQQVCMPMQC